MKLEIEIPESLYKGICENKFGVFNGRLYDIIREGRPLNKQDEILDKFVKQKGERK